MILVRLIAVWVFLMAPTLVFTPAADLPSHAHPDAEQLAQTAEAGGALFSDTERETDREDSEEDDASAWELTMAGLPAPMLCGRPIHRKAIRDQLLSDRRIKRPPRLS
jgi:hypothetical protein